MCFLTEFWCVLIPQIFFSIGRVSKGPCQTLLCYISSQLAKRKSVTIITILKFHFWFFSSHTFSHLVLQYFKRTVSCFFSFQEDSFLLFNSSINFNLKLLMPYLCLTLSKGSLSMGGVYVGMNFPMEIIPELSLNK